MIFHITNKKTWLEAQTKGVYDYCALKSDGFIHASTLEQTLLTANRFFSQQSDLVVLEIDESKVNSQVIYEPADRGEKIMFPHIYGPLNLDAIVGVKRLKINTKGEFIDLV